MTADRPPLAVNIETDDRTVLFPAGKFVTHISVQSQGTDSVRLDAIYSFNQAGEACEIHVLSVDNARAFARAILDSVFQGRSQHVINESARVMIVFNPNGFVISFGNGANAVDLYIASPAILRLSQALLRVADRLTPAQNH
jgi:hypothetical protein